MAHVFKVAHQHIKIDQRPDRQREHHAGKNEVIDQHETLAAGTWNGAPQELGDTAGFVVLECGIGQEREHQCKGKMDRARLPGIKGIIGDIELKGRPCQAQGHDNTAPDHAVGVARAGLDLGNQIIGFTVATVVGTFIGHDICPPVSTDPSLRHDNRSKNRKGGRLCDHPSLV